MSRQEYKIWKEILGLLKDGDAVAKINKLPETLDTLKRHAREQIGHIQMRTANIALNPHKLGSSRQHQMMAAGKEPIQALFYLNPIDFIERILQSSLGILVLWPGCFG